MKKSFALAAALVLVFAFAAMANSFTLEESVLASGSGDVNSCTDSTEVDYTYEWDSNNSFYRVTQIALRTDGGDCGGLSAQVDVLDEDDNVLASVTRNTLNTAGNTTFQAWEWGGHSNNNPLNVEDIHGSAAVIFD